MRDFSDREKDIIRKIVSMERGETIPLRRILEAFFFVEKRGRALIIQCAQQYAVFYLRNELFDSEKRKNDAIAQFMELILLIDYLKRHRYIAICGDSAVKGKVIHIMQDAFNSSKVGTTKIILNNRGLYTTSPEYIMDKSGNVVYKGIPFYTDVYELIVNNLLGVVYVSQELRALVKNQFNSREQIRHERQLKALHKVLWICTGTLVLLLCASLFFGFKTMSGDRFGQADRTNDSNVVEGQFTKPVDSFKIDGVDTKVHQVLYGIDISKYNGNFVQEIVPADSIAFTICKATQGINYIDPSFFNNWKLITEKGMIKGAYHFYSTADDPIKQADFFWRVLQRVGHTDIAPVVDIEQSSLDTNLQTNISTLQQDLLAFLNHIQKKSNRAPMIYTSLDFANQYLSNDRFSSYPLWLAEYTDKELPEVPFAWKKTGITIWQKSDQYNVHSKPTDFDIFYGEPTDLYK